MIRLELLRGPAVRGAAGGGLERVLAQPKHLALLTYLVLERRFVSRHTLLGVFWPELVESRGRATLRKALFLLRRELGGGVLLNRGDHEVGVCEEEIWCDAVEMQEAIEAKDHERVVSLYGRELLSGLYVPRAPEFERWVDGVRGRLQAAAEISAVTLAREQLEAGNAEVALAWGARAREIAPHSTEGTHLVMTALHRLGDHTRALEKYERHARQLRDEFGIGVSPRIRELASEIRAAARQQQPTAPAVATPSGPDRYRRFVECAADIMFEADGHGYVTEINPAGSRILGYPRDELIGRLYLDLVREDFREAAHSAQLRQREERTPTAYQELPVECADGRVVWLGHQVQLVEGAGGEPAGIQVVARDVSARIRLAEAQRYLAMRDRVTDLYSPMGFHSMADDRIKLARRTRHKLILLCIEARGLPAAEPDRGLIAVARLIESTFRASDVLSRVGDRRFAALALEPPERDDEQWVETIRGRLAETAREQGFPESIRLSSRVVYSGDAVGMTAERLLSICAAGAPRKAPVPSGIEIMRAPDQNDASTPSAGSTGNMLIPERVGSSRS